MGTKDSIRISERHGINPSLMQCFVCMQPMGVVLFGRLKDDAEAPRGVCLNQEPCDKCKALMAKGVILISVRETTDPEEQKNPYRTGGWVVVKEEAVERIFDPASAKAVLKRRMAFVTDETWDQLGIPRGAVEGVPSE